MPNPATNFHKNGDCSKAQSQQPSHMSPPSPGLLRLRFRLWFSLKMLNHTGEQNHPEEHRLPHFRVTGKTPLETFAIISSQTTSMSYVHWAPDLAWSAWEYPNFLHCLKPQLSANSPFLPFLFSALLFFVIFSFFSFSTDISCSFLPFSVHLTFHWLNPQENTGFWPQPKCARAHHQRALPMLECIKVTCQVWSLL